MEPLEGAWPCSTLSFGLWARNQETVSSCWLPPSVLGNFYVSSRKYIPLSPASFFKHFMSCDEEWLSLLFFFGTKTTHLSFKWASCLSRHVNLDFWKVVLNAETGRVSRHCHPSCLQGFPSRLTLGALCLPCYSCSGFPVCNTSEAAFSFPSILGF